MAIIHQSQPPPLFSPFPIPLSSKMPRVSNDPALESEVKRAHTYLNLADAVNPKWATIGVSLSTDLLNHRLGALQRLKRNAPPVDPAIDFGSGERVATREEAIGKLRACMSEDADKFSRAFGFYCAMAENDEVRDGGLRHACALIKLRRDNFGHFHNGVEAYKDYRAARAREGGPRPSQPASRPARDTVC